ANLWKTNDAFFSLAVSAVLDGAAGRRPGSASYTCKQVPRTWAETRRPASARPAPSPISAIREIRGSMCRRTSERQSLSFDTPLQRKKPNGRGVFCPHDSPQVLPSPDAPKPTFSPLLSPDAEDA